MISTSHTDTRVPVCLPVEVKIPRHVCNFRLSYRGSGGHAHRSLAFQSRRGPPAGLLPFPGRRAWQLRTRWLLRHWEAKNNPLGEYGSGWRDAPVEAEVCASNSGWAGARLVKGARHACPAQRGQYFGKTRGWTVAASRGIREDTLSAEPRAPGAPSRAAPTLDAAASLLGACAALCGVHLHAPGTLRSRRATRGRAWGSSPRSLPSLLPRPGHGATFLPVTYSER